ncbi:hypothetical protein X946_2555 [Burkholderia sp. ABCPW 111]|nr:hypothetical protein X946_2555 [Burkholderia sp. ABCPW 111]
MRHASHVGHPLPCLAFTLVTKLKYPKPGIVSIDVKPASASIADNSRDVYCSPWVQPITIRLYAAAASGPLLSSR